MVEDSVKVQGKTKLLACKDPFMGHGTRTEPSVEGHVQVKTIEVTTGCGSQLKAMNTASASDSAPRNHLR